MPAEQGQIQPGRNGYRERLFSDRAIDKKDCGKAQLDILRRPQDSEENTDGYRLSKGKDGDQRTVNEQRTVAPMMVYIINQGDSPCYSFCAMDNPI